MPQGNRLPKLVTLGLGAPWGLAEEPGLLPGLPRPLSHCGREVAPPVRGEQPHTIPAPSTLRVSPTSSFWSAAGVLV